MQIIHLTPNQQRYGWYTERLLADPLRTQWWDDAESRHEPDVAYLMVLDHDGTPAAWAGYRILANGTLRCCNNYVRREYRDRDPELYALAYAARHRDVVTKLGRPAETFLFPEPIALHLADGWVLDASLAGSGTSSPYPDGPVHHWQRLTWSPPPP